MGGHVYRWYLWGSYLCKQEENIGCHFLGNVHLKKKKQHRVSPSPQARLASSRAQRTRPIRPLHTHVNLPSLGFYSVSVSSGDGIAVLRLTRPSLYREPSSPSWRFSSHLDLFESAFSCRNQVIQKWFNYASRIIKGRKGDGHWRGGVRWRLSWSFPVPKDIKEEDRERSHQRSRRCFVPWPSPPRHESVGIDEAQVWRAKDVSTQGILRPGRTVTPTLLSHSDCICTLWTLKDVRDLRRHDRQVCQRSRATQHTLPVTENA